MVEDEKEGWKLTYRRVTPRWASYSGIRNEQIRYVRAIAVCNDRAALFVINYSSDENPVRSDCGAMVRSLKAEGC